MSRIDCLTNNFSYSTYGSIPLGLRNFERSSSVSTDKYNFNEYQYITIIIIAVMLALELYVVIIHQSSTSYNIKSRTRSPTSQIAESKIKISAVASSALRVPSVLTGRGRVLLLPAIKTLCWTICWNRYIGSTCTGNIVPV